MALDFEHRNNGIGLGRKTFANQWYPIFFVMTRKKNKKTPSQSNKLSMALKIIESN